MKDVLGNDVQVGDIVLTPYDRYCSLRKARVVKLTPTGVKVVFYISADVWTISQFFKQPSQIYSVSGPSHEKIVWEQADKAVTARMVLDAQLPTIGDNVTIRSFFIDCMTRLLAEDEGFSGKRPLGDSGWSDAILSAMAYLGIYDEAEAQAAVAAALETLA